jgi:hypothetical protein
MIGRYEQQLSCSIPYRLSCIRTRTLTARLWGEPLNENDKLRLQVLCAQIANEQNPERFQKLVYELNQMLAEIEEGPKSTKQTT